MFKIGVGVVAITAVLGGLYMWRMAAPKPLDQAAFDALYATPAPAPPEALSVLHLGHSLIGRDMPEMLMQLSEAPYTYSSQLGWGAFLKAHWDPDTPINGFETENDHPRFRAGHEAVASGEYNVLVLTEAVEIRDSIKYMDSPQMLHNWAQAAWDSNPGARVYLYETWHNLDDPEGWLNRLDRDLGLYWEGQILSPALNMQDTPRPIYVIPGGQVMAKVTRAIEDMGGIGPLETRQDLFKDTIHFNDYGAYLMALTHYAVLYQRSPVGLPYQLNKADGTPAQSLGPQAAALLQALVWEVVTGYAPTGVRG
jgi:hypothetical protein